MNFKDKTGKSISEAFAEFHKENPHVYGYFKSFFFYLHSKGWQKISAKLIVERCRGEIITITSAPDYKINNSYTAYYARLFVKEYPQHKKCFEFRELKS